MWKKKEKENKFSLPIHGVSPVPGSRFSSFGSLQAGGCCYSVTSLNGSGKGNFRSVVSMSKILSGVRISTKRIVKNGNKKISSVFNY